MASPFAPIPMPMSGMDAFAQGFAVSNDRYKAMMQNKRQEEQNQIQQQASDRANQLLPGQLQAQTDAQQLSPLTRAYLQSKIREMDVNTKGAAAIRAMMAGQDPNAAGSSGNAGSSGDSRSSSGTDLPQGLFPNQPNNNQQIVNPSMQSQPQSSQPNLPIDLNNIQSIAPFLRNNHAAPNNLSKISLMDKVGQTNMLSQLMGQQQGQKQVPSQIQSIPQPVSQQTQDQMPIPQQQAQPSNQASSQSSNYQPGQYSEQVISPGNPRMAGLDQFAGTTQFGIKVPEIKTSRGDGFEDDRYPSGKIIRRMTGPNAEQKAQITLNAAENKAQATSDVKENEKGLTDARQAVDNLKTAVEMKGLLDKGTPTGPLSGFKSWAGFGSEDQGTLRNLSNNLQGGSVKLFTSRGSNAALKIIGTGKPDVNKQGPYNIGLLRGVVQENLNQFNQIKTEWESRPTNKGKPFPLQAPDVSGLVKDPNQMVTVRDAQTGERRPMIRSDAESFINSQKQVMQ